MSNPDILVRNAKLIYIPVHKMVELSYMAIQFMGNKYFQRLSKLKQLGTCNYVYPGAVHTRFEHSIGVYYLTGRLLIRIKNSSDPETLHQYLKTIPELEHYYESDLSVSSDNIHGIGLTPWITELIKIAGLMHDIGHGPYSHLFDDVVIKNSDYVNHKMATHEYRSCEIVKRIVQENPILSKYLSENDVKFIQSLIDPTPDRTGFVYQIISNNLNGLDVDKYDYIMRDAYHLGLNVAFDHHRLIDSVLIINNQITYPEQSTSDIHNLFLARHYLHKTVYSHKAVISVQFIIVEIMKILNRVLKIEESVLDLNWFVKLTDEYILNYAEYILTEKTSKLNELEIKSLTELLNRLYTHDFYPHIGTKLSDKRINIDLFSSDEYVIYLTKIGYVSGNKSNPLDAIYVYRSKDFLYHDREIKSKRIDKTEISRLIPNTYQEYILMVFRRDRDSKKLEQDKLRFAELE